MKIIFVLFFIFSGTVVNAQKNEMLIRISEIEIAPGYVSAYSAILKKEADASVSVEKGVIAILPMYQKADSTQFRILEIYADTAAYQAHLKTAHFLEYKTSTLKMVKSLKLVDMKALSPEYLPVIFKKAN